MKHEARYLTHDFLISQPLSFMRKPIMSNYFPLKFSIKEPKVKRK